MEDVITYGLIMRKFAEQFPGLKVNDMRPNGTCEIYVWIDGSPMNLIALYNPSTDTFEVRSTRVEWRPYKY